MDDRTQDRKGIDNTDRPKYLISKVLVGASKYEAICIVIDKIKKQPNIKGQANVSIIIHNPKVYQFKEK